MATIRVCDYTKKILAKGEDVFTIDIEGIEGEVHKFEIGLEGKNLLLEHLEGDSEPGVMIRTIEKIVYRDAPPDTLQAAMPGLDIEVKDDPFDTGPSSMPQPAMGHDEAPSPLDDVPPIEIPAGHQRIKSTPAQRDKVVQESRRFEHGTLPALTAGGRAQREADARLRAGKDKDTRQLNRLGGDGIRLKDLNDL
jgi:hypothetical protein